MTSEFRMKTAFWAVVGALVLTMGTAPSQAQESEEEKYEGKRDGDTNQPEKRYSINKISTIHFTAGIGFFDFDSLNSRLSTEGFSKLEQPTLLLGGGGELRFWRFVMGAEGNWLRNLGSESQRDDFRADVRGGYWLFRTGFDIVQWKGLSIYPLLGIGSGHMKVRIDSEQGASFNDVLQNPGRSVEMRQDALLLDASLGVDYRFKVRETELGSSYFTIGVRGGYLFAPYNDGWDTRGAEISGGPDAGLSGPTVQLMLGFSRSAPSDCKRCGG